MLCDRGRVAGEICDKDKPNGDAPVVPRGTTGASLKSFATLFPILDTVGADFLSRIGLVERAAEGISKFVETTNCR